MYQSSHQLEDTGVRQAIISETKRKGVQLPVREALTSRAARGNFKVIVISDMMRSGH